MQNKPIPLTLILLVHNEAATIEKEILIFYEKIINKIPNSEFIISEDGSTDGTSEIIARLVNEKGIIHLTSKTKKGYKKALIDAILSAKGEFIFFSDTGLKHDPDDFWKLYDLRDQDYDLINGKKKDRKDHIFRRLLTFFYNVFLRICFNIKNISDADSGFKLFNKNVVDKVISKELIFTELVNSEIVVRTIYNGLKYREVPCSYCGRNGKSRALPVKKIPKVIFKTFKSALILRKKLQYNTTQNLYV